MSNKVPEGWKLGLFGDLAKVQNGYAFKSAEFSDTGYAAAIRMSNLKLGRVDLSDAKYVSQESIKGLDQFQLASGDFLFGMSGSLDNYAWVKKTDGICYLNQRVGCLRIKPQADPLYTSYCYLSGAVKDAIVGLAAGAAQLNISGNQLQEISILIPPLPEQQKIATILTSVDTVIEKTRAQIDKLKHLKTGMMQELLTKGIGHTEFKDTPVGRIPKIWNIYTAQELLNSKTLLKLQDGNHGSQYPRALDFVSSGVPYIAASHISETGEINFNNCPHLSQKHANELRIRPAMGGDVILTHNATVGRTAIIPDDRNEVIASTSTTYYRTNNAKLLNRYLYYYFQSTSYISQLLSIMGQTTRNQVPITTQRELLIIIPPIQEQIILADTIEVVAHNIKAKCEKLDSLILLKKALMQDLLTGNKRTHAF